MSNRINKLLRSMDELFTAAIGGCVGLFSLGDQHHLSINPHAYPTGFLAIVYGVTIGSYITERVKEETA